MDKWSLIGMLNEWYFLQLKVGTLIHRFACFQSVEIIPELAFPVLFLVD